MAIIFITIVLFVIYAAIIVYYLIGWHQIPTFSPTKGYQNTFISVIIPARNEEKNIAACLSSIINQTYPKHLFEIIVIDDHSIDATVSIVQAFTAGNISIISLKEHLTSPINSYKKKGIEIGISKAKGELIVTTDADCIVPSTWLQTIASFYEQYQPAFIAAPVAYSNSKNMLHIFQSLDFMMLQGITAAAVFKRFHTMCNGANLAYEKKEFYEVGGFTGIDNIASGDDMLLMHKIYQRNHERVLFLKSSSAIVETKPMQTLSEFFNQRIRWASKADKYTDKKITGILFVVYFFNVWVMLLGILSCFYHSILFWFIGTLIAKTFIELIFIYPVAKFFNKQKILWWFPVAQPFHILYTIIAGWLGKFGSYKWKGRTVK